MKLEFKNKTTQLLILLIIASCTYGFISKAPRQHHPRINASKEVEIQPQKLSNFTLADGEEYKLVNSSIKQFYTIAFSGEIVKFDTLTIGKGSGRYLTSNLIITPDSIIANRVTNVTARTAIKHQLKLKNEISIKIERGLSSSTVTIINENDTLSFSSDFIGMNQPFIHSSGTEIKVDTFEFICEDYKSDVFVFGDSYVSSANPSRWPYYIHAAGYQFLCDGLPGGKSKDSYDFINAAFSIHKPKYAIWCLGMNDKSDVERVANDEWKAYVEKVIKLCDESNVTLIFATVPTVEIRNNRGKNDFVRASGYRYIDFDEAVSDGEGNWKAGMLAKDGVHPAEIGAKAMADRFMADFPEIKNYIR
ncbi:SGNH/GDSL hydrolase family protein [Cyclobacterium amurskyense]|uniref:Ester hydrolase n=1 Tax=Cyclobacterium amurskyense TaxID=320787 RepID=A0A0H4PCN4_9BACT|nr:SGNH/GDSL hydrolase family protein [Cyclobacterium amurskyense]AKP50573.1 Ester hydrolase [Cyclobacterium amurskyense]